MAGTLDCAAWADGMLILSSPTPGLACVVDIYESCARDRAGLYLRLAKCRQHVKRNAQEKMHSPATREPDFAQERGAYAEELDAESLSAFATFHSNTPCATRAR